MDKIFTYYHVHSDLSNGVTNIDSVTKFKEYIDHAKAMGFKAFGFSEHGNIFEWEHKKTLIEASGMKYLHSVEMYLTETLDEKIRDNYHCILIAKNYEGFRELNKLITTSFNRDDNHFYYVPRISLDELFKTTDNIIITTACIGGVLGKGSDKAKERYIDFLKRNKHRCFLEIGHHLDFRQVEYNSKIYKLSKQYGIKLIVGTDTHALNDIHIKGRSMLQKSKKIHFDDEDNWDLSFKTYDELIDMFKKQNAIPIDDVVVAIENTNLLADMVDSFELDKSIKYPKIYENSEKTFIEKIENARKNHPYINDRYEKGEIDEIINNELEVYKKTESIDFMLLQSYLREWEISNGIYCGYGRGSVSGSMIAYILGITNMDSKRFDLNFFRFMNPSRVTNCDIDTDYSSVDRDKVKAFLLDDKLNLPNIKTCEIITFNTIALKGAIRDIGRALEIPLAEINTICKDVDTNEVELRAKYKELFELVDIVSGTIVSIGTHPSGVVVSDVEIEELIGLCTTSNSKYPVSMLNMKELDDLFYVKLDILGLDNIALINDTCKMIGIERLTPDNTPLDDMKVWKSIRDDTTCIFQWESESSAAYLRKFMSDEVIEKVKPLVPNFSMMTWLSFGNGLIRPACASFRNEVAEGIFYDNGLKELNDFLSPTL